MTPRLIDFHSHYYEAEWYSSASLQGPASLSHAWPLLMNIEAQLAAMDEAAIDAKVLTAPTAAIATPGQPLTTSLIERINDRLAELVARYPERLLALATIDAFQGDAAAHEVQRAIQTLGLGGICVDCAQGDRYLDAPEARPTFEAAAELGVPVFVHPVSPAGFTERLARLGHIGVLLARGTENAASLLALLRSGILDDLPTLNVVLPMIGVSALFFAGMADQERGREEGWSGGLPSVTRQRFYIDTMGFDPAAIHFAIGLLGAEHVLVGSDWPIMPIVSRQRIEHVLVTLQLSDEQTAAILGGNTLSLLTQRSAHN